MESDLSNPAALAWFDTVDETALEASIRPQAVFADVTIQGSVSGDGPSTTTAAPVAAPAATGIDPRWVAALAVLVIVIGAVAVLDSKR